MTISLYNWKRKTKSRQHDKNIYCIMSEGKYAYAPSQECREMDCPKIYLQEAVMEDNK